MPARVPYRGRFPVPAPPPPIAKEWVTPFRDDFTRANASTLGVCWATVSGTGLGISSSNSVQVTGGAGGTGGISVVVDTIRIFGPDQYAQVKATAMNANHNGLALRGGQITVEWALAVTLRITLPTLIDTGVSVAVNDVIKAQVVADVVTLYKNAVQVWTGTIVTSPSGNPGMNMTNAGDSTLGCWQDEFVGGEFLALDWQQMFVEGFNRPDGPIFPDSNYWAVVTGTFSNGGVGQIEGAQYTMRGSTNINGIYNIQVRDTVAAPFPAQAVEAAFTENPANTPVFGLITRMVPLTQDTLNGQFWSGIYVKFARNSACLVTSNINNSFVDIFSSGVIPQLNDIVRLEVIGTLARLLINGVLIGSGNHMRNTLSITSGQPGFYGSGITTGATLSKIDAFRAFTLVP